MSVDELILQLKAFSSPPTEAEKIALNTAIDQHCLEQSKPELNLDHKDLKLVDYQNLFSVLKSNTTVKHLNLRQLDPKDRVYPSKSSIIKSLCDLLAHNATLTSLNLRSSMITTSQAINLLEALSKNPNTALTVLDLSNNEISFDPKLVSVSVYDSQKFIFNHTSQLQSEFVSALIRTKKLEKISLTHNRIPFRDREGVRLLLENLHKNSSLMQCNIDDNDVSKIKVDVTQYLSKIPIDQLSVMRPATFLGQELSATLAKSPAFLDPKDVGQVLATSPLPLEVAKIVNTYLGFSADAFETGFKNPPLEKVQKRDEPKPLLEEPTRRESLIEPPKVIMPEEQAPEPKIPILLPAQSNQKKWLQRGAVFLAVSAVVAFATLFVLGLPIVAGVLLAILGAGSLVTYGVSRKYSVSDIKASTPAALDDVLEKQPPPKTVDVVEKISVKNIHSDKVENVPQNLDARSRSTLKPD